MVAWMIVVVGNGCVEDNATEKFGAIPIGFGRPAAQVIGEQRVGPLIAVKVMLVAAEHRQTANQAKPEVSAFRMLTVEAFDHQHIPSADCLDAWVADMEAAFSSELQRRVFDPLQIASVSLLRELAEP